MLRVVYNEYKGFCIPRSRHETEEGTSTAEIFTNGFEYFDWGDDKGEHLKTPLQSQNGHHPLPGQNDDNGDAMVDDMYGNESRVALNHGGDSSDDDVVLLSHEIIPLDDSKKGKLSKKASRNLKRAGKKLGKQVKKKPQKGKMRGKNDELERNEPSNPQLLKIFNRIYRDTMIEVGKKTKDDQKVLQFFDVSLYKEDIDNLRDDEWLSDNNISFIFEYLERYQLSKYSKLVSQSIELVRPSMVHLLANVPSPQDLKGVIPPLERAKFLFLPINDSDELDSVGSGWHWSLVVVSMLDQTAFIYDTLERANETEARSVIAKLEQYLGNQISFDVKVMDTPQQINGSDCGMMVAQISAFLLSRLLRLEHLKEFYVNLDLKGVTISAIAGRIFTLGTLLNLIRHKKESSPEK